MGDLLRMPDRPTSQSAPEPLWREAVGEQLRRRRHGHRKTLGEVAERAGISTQYLSEIERGLKDPSSEILAAVAGALDLTLMDLTTVITRDLGSQRRSSTPQGPLARAI